MTAVIHCSRCKRDVAGFGELPLPGSQGEELLAHTCPECFKDWMGTEVMIINEYRLDLAVQRNQDMLNDEMARFLNLPSAGGAAPTGAPPQAIPEKGEKPEKAGHSHGSGGSCC